MKDQREMAIDVNALSDKVDAISKQVAVLNQTVIKLAEVQVQLAEVIKHNDRQNETIKEIEQRLRIAEQSIATNHNTINLSERWAWAGITIVIAILAIWAGI